MRGRRAARVALGALALVGLGGCEAAIRVGVEVGDRGSGTVTASVTLDREARAAFAGDIRDQLDVDDLEASGWDLQGPTRVGDGATRITLVKQFARPGDVAGVLRELDGGNGLLQRFTVEQDRSFFRTVTRFRGEVDLTEGIDSFTDERVRSEAGPSLGASAEDLRRRIGAKVDEILPVTVGIRLPGDAEANAPRTSGGAAAWRPKLGEEVALRAEATRWHTATVGFTALALVAGGLAAVSGLRYARTRRR